jgi:hypothetical protein
MKRKGRMLRFLPVSIIPMHVWEHHAQGPQTRLEAGNAPIPDLPTPAPKRRSSTLSDPKPPFPDTPVARDRVAYAKLYVENYNAAAGFHRTARRRF